MSACVITLPGIQLPPVYGPGPHRAWYLPPMRAGRRPKLHTLGVLKTGVLAHAENLDVRVG